MQVTNTLDCSPLPLPLPVSAWCGRELLKIFELWNQKGPCGTSRAHERGAWRPKSVRIPTHVSLHPSFPQGGPTVSSPTLGAPARWPHPRTGLVSHSSWAWLAAAVSQGSPQGAKPAPASSQADSGGGGNGITFTLLTSPTQDINCLCL